MKQLINITSSLDDQQRFSGEEDLKFFYRKFGCEGLEYLRLDAEETSWVKDAMICGVHMRSFNSWMDPEFLVLELISSSRQEHEKLLSEQVKALEDISL